MSKDLKNTMLLDVYGPLLTEKQRETLELYYNEDLSLGEISEVTGTTRQAVMKCIKTSEIRLSELERDMGLVERFGVLKAELEELEEIINKKIDSSEITDKINEIKAKL